MKNKKYVQRNDKKRYVDTEIKWISLSWIINRKKYMMEKNREENNINE